mgnify:CR=1 FL=1
MEIKCNQTGIKSYLYIEGVKYLFGGISMEEKILVTGIIFCCILCVWTLCG